MHPINIFNNYNVSNSLSIFFFLSLQKLRNWSERNTFCYFCCSFDYFRWKRVSKKEVYHSIGQHKLLFHFRKVVVEEERQNIFKCDSLSASTCYGILVRKKLAWRQKNKNEWPLTDDARKNRDIFRYSKRSRAHTKADMRPTKTYDNNFDVMDTSIFSYSFQLFHTSRYNPALQR